VRNRNAKNPDFFPAALRTANVTSHLTRSERRALLLVLGLLALGCVVHLLRVKGCFASAARRR